MGYRTEHLRQNEVVVDLHTLLDLREKAAAHDASVRTARNMGRLMQAHIVAARDASLLATERTYHLGWLDCLKAQGDMTLQLLSQEMDAHPHLSERPKRVKKGQTCIIDEHGCKCLLLMRAEG